MLNRRTFTMTAVGAAITGALSPMTAFAQAIPDMVKIIVGFPPGGPTDTFARLISQKVMGTLAPMSWWTTSPVLVGKSV